MARAMQGRLPEAEQALRAALQLDPARPRTYSVLGDVLTQLGRTNEAVQVYREALRIDPNLPRARAALHELEAELNDPGSP
jgi:Flp pilus assembly protein TadD